MQKQFSEQEIDFGFSLTNEVFNGAVFGESLDISKISHQHLTKLFYEVYKLTASALQPLASFQPQLVSHILDKTILKSVAFISAVAYELLRDYDEFPALSKAGAAMALVQIADHLMDRGDAKMVTALQDYFDGQSHPDAEIQARKDILWAIVALSYETSEDEGALVSESMLAILRDELAVYQLSKSYSALETGLGRQHFLEDFACDIANLSIRNGGLRPGTYMVYSCYRAVCPELPSIASMMTNEMLEPLSYFGEWAIRLWDDFGDQELDASQGIYTNSYCINPFVEQNETLSAAYLGAFEDDADCFNLLNAIERNTGKIIDLIAFYVRSISDSLPRAVLQEHRIYLSILRRIIEAGYVNARGDEGISYSRDIIADYA